MKYVFVCLNDYFIMIFAIIRIYMLPFLEIEKRLVGVLLKQRLIQLNETVTFLQSVIHEFFFFSRLHSM